MKTRCFNPKCKYFTRYGGRGITVCDRWRNDFKTFLADMGTCPPGLTLERIDNDGIYEPGNCKWATQFEQCNNRTGLRRFEYQGEKLTIAEWSRRTGMPEWKIRRRLDAGESPERILDPSITTVKLSIEKVSEIKRRLALREPHRSIAKSFGVDRSTITAVSCGKNWKDAANPRVIVTLEIIE